MTPSEASHHGGAVPTRAVAIRLIINAVVPVLVYLLVRPHTPNDLTALVIGAAIPTAYTLGVLLARRRLDPVGVIAIACFCVGLLIAIATGGNELVFKLREDLWTGPLGLACLVSVAVHRPLLHLALGLAGRRNAEIADRIHRPQSRRVTTVSTVVIGAILIVHAIVMVTIALTTSTATYLAISRPISWTIVIGGLAGLMWWIRSTARTRD